MKKYIVLGLLLLSIIVPVAVFAQTEVDPNGPASSCVSLQNNLRYQSRDISTNGEVSTLQDFLQTKGYLNSEPTGYFGLLTVKASKAFQAANGINGDGYVGPITRAKISVMTCGTTSTPPVMCTMEAKQCSDGSYVGRTGPKCEFSKCPTIDSSIDVNGCRKGTIFSTTTGQRCGGTTFREGCTSTLGFSSTNGFACDGSVPSTVIGCATTSGFSTTTGEYCDGSHPQTTPAPVIHMGQATVISPGQRQISWDATNVTSCNSVKNGSYDAALFSSTENSNPGGSFTVLGGSNYSVKCKGPGGSAISDTVRVSGDASTCTTSGFDSTTGLRCGCVSASSGFSTTTGEYCDGSHPAQNPPVDTSPINPLTPYGGETYQTGQTFTIRWSGSDYAWKNHDLWLLKGDAGSGNTQALFRIGTATVLPEKDVQGFNWTISSDIPSGTDYQIQFGKEIAGTSGVFSIMNPADSNFPPGCSSSESFSTTTGMPCNTPLPDGCSSYDGWSTTTGQACNGTQ